MAYNWQEINFVTNMYIVHICKIFDELLFFIYKLIVFLVFGYEQQLHHFICFHNSRNIKCDKLIYICITSTYWLHLNIISTIVLASIGIYFLIFLASILKFQLWQHIFHKVVYDTGSLPKLRLICTSRKVVLVLDVKIESFVY